MLVTLNYSDSLKMFSDVDYNQGWILYSRTAQQITKADRLRVSRSLRKAKSAPRYGGLVPPFYVSKK